MKHLYIDFTHSIPMKRAKVHGGGNFTKQMLLDMEAYILRKSNIDTNIILIWPKDYRPQNEVEERIYNSKVFSVLQTDSALDDINYQTRSTLYLPLLGVKEFPLIKTLKSKNPGIRLILTVHGLRLLDLFPDNYDKAYLVTGRDKITYWGKERALLGLRKSIYKKNVKTYLPYCDAISTDSNYSLSRIFELSKVEKILSMTLDATVDEKTRVETPISSDYMLFVSGSRFEKNLARTLVAYKQYLEEDPGIQKMIITGVNPDIAQAIISFTGIEDLVEREKVIFKGYVSLNELQDLYKNAAYLVYTSKSEGYGLPALEAAYHGCLTLAAVGTSIPEVLGNGAYYVSPYSEESIAEGMHWMDRWENRKELLQRMNSMVDGIQDRIRISNDCLYRMLLEEE